MSNQLPIKHEQPQPAPLNGAYYGPPIPPQAVYSRPPNRGRRILSILLSTLVVLILLLGITALVLWLVYRPTRMRVHVENASINQFNLTNPNTLQYNLSVQFSFRNPNSRIGIYYDRLDARAYYRGERFVSIFLPTFYQGHKNTTTLTALFQGLNFVSLSSSDLERFGRESSDGSFYIDVNIYARVRFKVGSVRSRRYRPDFKCKLRVPVLLNGASIAGFARTKCDVDF